MAKRARVPEKRSISGLCSSRTLINWSNSAVSEVAAIKGSFSTRLSVRHFCVAMIEQLQQSSATVIWAFNTTMNDARTSDQSHISSVDILRHLTLQALKTTNVFAHEKALSVTCSQFHSATTSEEWFQIFECVVTRLNGPVFIIIDLHVLHHVSLEGEEFNWSKALVSFMNSLSQRSTRTILKFLLVGYGPSASAQISSTYLPNKIVTCRTPPAAKHRNPTRSRGGLAKFGARLG